MYLKAKERLEGLELSQAATRDTVSKAHKKGLTHLIKFETFAWTDPDIYTALHTENELFQCLITFLQLNKIIRIAIAKNSIFLPCYSCWLYVFKMFAYSFCKFRVLWFNKLNCQIVLNILLRMSLKSCFLCKQLDSQVCIALKKDFFQTS